jgi:hypothetical protein
MTEKQYSIMEYQYRDASNYKESGEILLEGLFSEKDSELIRSCMYDCGQSFIPEEIGIPPLQHILWDKYDGPNEDDHEWHSIECIRIAQEQDLTLPIWGTKQQLIENFQQNWTKVLNFLK